MEKKLCTWGEIAKFCDVSISTVKRWKKYRHLPINKTDNKKQARVFAWITLLDNWLCEYWTKNDP